MYKGVCWTGKPTIAMLTCQIYSSASQCEHNVAIQRCAPGTIQVLRIMQENK